MGRIGWCAVLVLLAGTTGCEEEGERVPLTEAPGEVAAPTPAPGSTPGATPGAAPAPAPAEAQTRLAKVVEVLPAGEYTIARMDACGVEAWTAGPPTELTVGQTVEMSSGMVMEKFHSKTLKRDFDVILFVDWYRPSEQPVPCPTAAAPHAPGTDDPGPGKPGHGGGAELGSPGNGTRFTGKVVETMDSGGYTYAKLASCGKEQWVAGSPTPVKVGQTLVAVDGLPMTNFTSKTLGRVFDNILFVRTLTHVEGEPKCN
jgi:hypothetical protein